MPESDYIDDAAAPVKKPEGAPDLTPLLQLPRRQRASVMRKLDGLLKRQASIPAVPEQGEDDDQTATLERAAGMFDLLADFEELLRDVSKDKPLYDAWLEGANDADLTALAGYYMRTFQAGEAQASPAS